MTRIFPCVVSADYEKVTPNIRISLKFNLGKLTWSSIKINFDRMSLNLRYENFLHALLFKCHIIFNLNYYSTHLSVKELIDIDLNQRDMYFVR